MQILQYMHYLDAYDLGLISPGIETHPVYPTVWYAAG